MDDNNPLAAQNQIKHCYFKNDVIPVDPKYMYLVCEGVVKLSTFLEDGEELIIGLASAEMLFGSCLSALQVYQARAFSKKVTLISFPWEEAIAFTNTAQELVPKVIHLVQQTQLFLTIHGYRHISKRLYHLLLLLKKEFGQAVDQGTRISVRLTHNDIACICATSRVTITRLLNDFQKQGMLTFDKNKYIILIDDIFNNY